MRAERESSRGVFPTNPEGGILDVVAPCPIISVFTVARNVTTVWGQKGSSDALFTPKMDTFKQTILNTAYIKTLEIFPPARESLSIEISACRSMRN